MSDGYEVVETEVQPKVSVILEAGPRNWSAYAPSVPGCIATGMTREEVEQNIADALTAHLQWLHEDALREEAEAERSTSAAAMSTNRSAR